MADHCNICDTRRPEGGTKAMVLSNNIGSQWVEFCEDCAHTEMRNEETKEVITVKELYDRITLRRTEHDT